MRVLRRRAEGRCRGVEGRGLGLVMDAKQQGVISHGLVIGNGQGLGLIRTRGEGLGSSCRSRVAGQVLAEGMSWHRREGLRLWLVSTRKALRRERGAGRLPLTGFLSMTAERLLN